MTFLDIRKGIIRLLRDNTDVENITGEDLETTKDYFSSDRDGNEATLPAFLVGVQPVSVNNSAAGRHMEKSAYVDISYMEERYTSRESIQKRMDEVAALLLPALWIENRAFSPALSFNITDGIGHCTFPLAWTDTVPFEAEEIPAGEIEIRF